MKTKILCPHRVRRFNFLVGLFDYETGGMRDRATVAEIADYLEQNSNPEMAAELRTLAAQIYGTK